MSKQTDPFEALDEGSEALLLKDSPAAPRLRPAVKDRTDTQAALRAAYADREATVTETGITVDIVRKPSLWAGKNPALIEKVRQADYYVQAASDREEGARLRLGAAVAQEAAQPDVVAWTAERATALADTIEGLLDELAACHHQATLLMDTARLNGFVRSAVNTFVLPNANQSMTITASVLRDIGNVVRGES